MQKRTKKTRVCDLLLQSGFGQQIFSEKTLELSVNEVISQDFSTHHCKSYVLEESEIEDGFPVAKKEKFTCLKIEIRLLFNFLEKTFKVLFFAKNFKIKLLEDAL